MGIPRRQHSKTIGRQRAIHRAAKRVKDDNSSTNRREGLDEAVQPTSRSPPERTEYLERIVCLKAQNVHREQNRSWRILDRHILIARDDEQRTTLERKRYHRKSLESCWKHEVRTGTRSSTELATVTKEKIRNCLCAVKVVSKEDLRPGNIL